ncbi:hypothetical protein [Parasedimentitalea maritima]|uniref:Uncharacterized protein n=1 Tax=Parasedimentitalea maritima TaxID=2578117 RepID=A0A6A4RA57_9RHOB|nr:hypothetical protein [Zongyanglinia marina]KAE9626472.1 hypothetical protein GP644_20690 [Zongyanglinia marina]
MINHIGQIPAHAAQTFGDKTALIFEDQSFSYNALNALIEAVVRGLHGLGIREVDTALRARVDVAKVTLVAFRVVRMAAIWTAMSVTRVVLGSQTAAVSASDSKVRVPLIGKRGLVCPSQFGSSGPVNKTVVAGPLSTNLINRSAT